MMDRTRHYHNGTTGEHIESITHDVSWQEVKDEREKWLTLTDNWYWADRWVQVDPDLQVELNEFRQAWRDITEHETANDACDAAPECPAWARDWERSEMEGAE